MQYTLLPGVTVVVKGWERDAANDGVTHMEDTKALLQRLRFYGDNDRDAAADLIERQAAELEAASKDAARYRWWRDSPDSPIANEARATDAWVDAAIARTAQEQKDKAPWTL